MASRIDDDRRIDGHWPFITRSSHDNARNLAVTMLKIYDLGMIEALRPVALTPLE
jgi:hypothetical protein